MSENFEIREQGEAALSAVLASKTFAKSQNLARLLQYLCRKHLDGSSSELKEYNIGVEALGRPADFDPSENSVVRVEIHRLREKLKKYYSSEGAGDPCIISLRPGNYAPQFLHRETPATGAASSEAPGSSLGGAAPNGRHSSSAEPRHSNGSSDLPRPGWTPIYIGAAAAAAVVVTILLLHVQSLSRARVLHPPAFERGAPAGANGAGAEAPVRILAGYTKDEYVDRAGEEWQRDRYYSGGEAATVAQRFFLRTLDPTIFETNRSGDFSYNIPLAPGTYELRLYFTETSYGPDTLSGGGETSRLFTVKLNGKPILTAFDILSDSDGDDVADVRAFKDVRPAPDGYLHLSFERYIADPLVNAIEVVPAKPGKLNPIRIVVADNCFTDHEGRFWHPDCYFEGGRLALRKVAVAGTSDPGLYASERFGHFDYAIPVAPGRYRLTLNFAETYFGAGNPGGGGAGSRSFDVYCNGTALLRNFDIDREAGGANRALQKVFEHLEPNAQGKLVLRFVPRQNYACVNAIEVEDEAK